MSGFNFFYLFALFWFFHSCTTYTDVYITVSLRDFSGSVLSADEVQVRIYDAGGTLLAEETSGNPRKMEVRAGEGDCWFIEAVARVGSEIYYGESPCVDLSEENVEIYAVPVSGYGVNASIRADAVCAGDGTLFTAVGSVLERRSLSAFMKASSFGTWREGAGIACYREGVFVTGGYDGDLLTDEVCHVTSEGSECWSMPRKLISPAGAFFQGRAYFCGGSTEGGGKYIGCFSVSTEGEVVEIGEANYLIERPVFVNAGSQLYLYTGLAIFRVRERGLERVADVPDFTGSAIYSSGETLYIYFSGTLFSFSGNSLTEVISDLPLLTNPVASSCGDGGVIVGDEGAVVLSADGSKRTLSFSRISRPLGAVRVGRNTVLILRKDDAILISCAEVMW